jgi:hypothetical protein
LEEHARKAAERAAAKETARLTGNGEDPVPGLEYRQNCWVTMKELFPVLSGNQSLTRTPTSTALEELMATSSAPLTDWAPLVATLKNSRPGAHAFVKIGRPNKLGHAIALYHTGDNNVIGINPTTPGHASILTESQLLSQFEPTSTAAPAADRLPALIHARVLVFGHDGQIITPAWSQEPAPYAHALTDPTDSHMGGLFDRVTALLNRPADRPRPVRGPERPGSPTLPVDLYGRELMRENGYVVGGGDGELVDVPKYLHFIWIGGAALRPSAKRNIRDWQNRVRSTRWEIHIWTDRQSFQSNYEFFNELSGEGAEISLVEAGLIPPTHKWVYDYAISESGFAMASDVARYTILLRHGGVYVDVDHGPGSVKLPKKMQMRVGERSVPFLAPLLRDRRDLDRARMLFELKHWNLTESDLLEETARLSYSGGWFNNSFIVTPPNSPFLRRVYGRIPNMVRRHMGDPKYHPKTGSEGAMALTGPKVWASVWNDEAEPSGTFGTTRPRVDPELLEQWIGLQWITEESNEQELGTVASTDHWKDLLAQAPVVYRYDPESGLPKFAVRTVERPGQRLTLVTIEIRLEPGKGVDSKHVEDFWERLKLAVHIRYNGERNPGQDTKWVEVVEADEHAPAHLVIPLVHPKNVRTEHDVPVGQYSPYYEEIIARHIRKYWNATTITRPPSRQVSSPASIGPSVSRPSPSAQSSGRSMAPRNEQMAYGGTIAPLQSMHTISPSVQTWYQNTHPQQNWGPLHPVHQNNQPSHGPGQTGYRQSAYGGQRPGHRGAQVYRGGQPGYGPDDTAYPAHQRYGLARVADPVADRLPLGAAITVRPDLAYASRSDGRSREETLREAPNTTGDGFDAAADDATTPSRGPGRIALARLGPGKPHLFKRHLGEGSSTAPPWVSYTVTVDGHQTDIELPDGARVPGEGWYRHGPLLLHPGDHDPSITTDAQGWVLFSDTGWIGRIDNTDALFAGNTEPGMFNPGTAPRYRISVTSDSLNLTPENRQDTTIKLLWEEHVPATGPASHTEPDTDLAAIAGPARHEPGRPQVDTDASGTNWSRSSFSAFRADGTPIPLEQQACVSIAVITRTGHHGSAGETVMAIDG